LFIGIIDKTTDKELQFAIDEKKHNLSTGNALEQESGKGIMIFNEEIEHV
jgi:hypothetical protein